MLLAALAVPTLACELISSVDRSQIGQEGPDASTGPTGDSPACGDGKVDPGEACDDGPSNGTTACGCTASCQLVAQGTACSDDDVCNGAEVCDGAGKCASPGPLDCDDEQASTADFCAQSKGCAHFGFTAIDPTLVRGNAVGGTEFLDACPAGRVLIGFNAEIGDSFDKIQAVCGVVGVGPGNVVTITGSETPFPLRGENANTAASSTCPANQFVVGFAGRAGALMDQISLRCAPVTITAGDGGGYAASLGAITPQAPVGGTGGTVFPDTDCPDGSVAVGAHIQAGGSVDGFGLLCGVPTVN